METVVGLPRSGTRSVIGRRRSNTQGSPESAPALPVLPVENTAYNVKARAWLPERTVYQSDSDQESDEDLSETAWTLLERIAI